MNRAEAIEILKTWRENMANHGVPDFGEKYKALGMAIEALQKQTVYEQVKWERDMALQTLEEHGIGLGQKSGWIHVSERLPIEDGYYLAQYKTGSMDVLSWAEGWNCHRYNDGTVVRNNEMKSIVAWMELPKPYPYKESDSE